MNKEGVQSVNLSAISPDRWYGRLLRRLLGLLPDNMVIPILQGRLRGKKWIVGSCTHGCWLGSYEYEMQKAFVGRVAEGSIVYDIGAHVGYYTLLASVIVGRQGRVIAFEPLPRNLQLLSKHLQMNRISNVEIIEAAVSDCEGEVFFKEGPVHTMGKVADYGELRVRAVAIDDIVDKGDIPPPTHMKIDVEGGEVGVLTGAKSVLTRYHPDIFLATHGSDIRDKCCRFLDSLGYSLRPIGSNDLETTKDILATREDSAKAA